MSAIEDIVGTSAAAPAAVRRTNVPQCDVCRANPAAMRRPSTGESMCRPCFFAAVEATVHKTITTHNIFAPGDVVACGASGGKDSTVLMHLVTLLNERHSYGIRIVLVSVDEGIAGYRDDSLETVKRNSAQYQLPLTIVSYNDLFGGWTMDRVVQRVGTKSNCTYCGVFRRQALERGAVLAGATKIATGHNCDDTAETVLMNLLRADVTRLRECTNAETKEADPDEEGGPGALGLPRVKPLRDLYEKEIVLYAHFKRLEYFTTECTYSKEAFRGHARGLLKALEAVRPCTVADIVQAGSQLMPPGPPPGARAPATHDDAASSAAVTTTTATSVRGPAQRCTRCGYLSSRPVCRACTLVASLHGDAAAAPRMNVGGAVVDVGRSA